MNTTSSNQHHHQQQQRSKPKWKGNLTVLFSVTLVLVVTVAAVLLARFRLLSPQHDKDESITNSRAEQEDQRENGEGADVSLSPESLSPTTVPTHFTYLPTEEPPSFVFSALPSETPSTTMDEVFLPNSVPENPPSSYFNYNIQDEIYGPNAWDTIDMGGTYWGEFGDKGFGTWNQHLSETIPDPTKNRCGHPGKQSPVHLTPFSNAINCTATHQIRHRAGRLPLSNDLIQKRFEPNSLRIQLNRRRCLDLDNNECKIYRPPIADFPNYSSQVTHFADLMHIDLKIAGEHTIHGAPPFDAELQFMHVHQDDPRIAYIGIPVQAKDGIDNEEFQSLLDQFQLEYDRDRTECSYRNNRQMREWSKMDPIRLRKLQQRQQKNFDPYSAFLQTVFFYRYNGSSPDPPCIPATWFVSTKPLSISPHQLRQMKRLLFTHVDSECRPTSVHNMEPSVARPIQELGVLEDSGEARTLMLCQEGDFLPDSGDGL